MAEENVNAGESSNTGSEGGGGAAPPSAIIEAMERIRNGQATRMLAGGSEGASPYIWAGFDAMRVICRKFNDRPEQASRPMSATACGFVPGAGGALFMLEELQ